MKKVILFSLVALANLQAHHPVINYALINEWCTSIQSLNQGSLKIMQTYLQDLETFATCCVENPECFETSEGKALQQKINEDVSAIMHNQDLIPVFEHLTMLIKEEVGQEKFTLLNQRKKEYELLAQVVKGCLECIERKLA